MIINPTSNASVKNPRIDFAFQTAAPFQFSLLLLITCGHLTESLKSTLIKCNTFKSCLPSCLHAGMRQDLQNAK